MLQEPCPKVCLCMSKNASVTLPDPMLEGSKYKQAMRCSPFCPVSTCCDLSIVLAQAPSRVHSEPVINNHEITGLE